MDEIDERLENAIDRIAVRVQNELILSCPVDRGLLRNSIKVKSSDGQIGLIISMNETGKWVEFGCFFKDIIIIKTKKGSKKLRDLKMGDLIWTGKDYKKLIQKEKLEIGYSIKKVIIKTQNKKLEVTEDHPIWTNKGWKKAGELKKGDRIKCLGI